MEKREIMGWFESLKSMLILQQDFSLCFLFNVVFLSRVILWVGIWQSDLYYTLSSKRNLSLFGEVIQ